MQCARLETCMCYLATAYHVRCSCTDPLLADGSKPEAARVNSRKLSAAGGFEAAHIYFTLPWLILEHCCTHHSASGRQADVLFKLSHAYSALARHISHRNRAQPVIVAIQGHDSMVQYRFKRRHICISKSTSLPALHKQPYVTDAKHHKCTEGQ